MTCCEPEVVSVVGLRRLFAQVAQDAFSGGAVALDPIAGELLGAVVYPAAGFYIGPAGTKEALEQDPVTAVFVLLDDINYKRTSMNVVTSDEDDQGAVYKTYLASAKLSFLVRHEDAEVALAMSETTGQYVDAMSIGIADQIPAITKLNLRRVGTYRPERSTPLHRVSSVAEFELEFNSALRIVAVTPPITKIALDIDVA